MCIRMVKFCRSTKVHTNGLENSWSLLKRGIKGTYVSVESFHLHRYLDEEVFQFNNRKTDDGSRFVKAAPPTLASSCMAFTKQM